MGVDLKFLFLFGFMASVAYCQIPMMGNAPYGNNAPFGNNAPYGNNGPYGNNYGRRQTQPQNSYMKTYLQMQVMDSGFADVANDLIECGFGPGGLGRHLGSLGVMMRTQCIMTRRRR